MTTTEIAHAVNERGRYEKRDGGAVTAFQIHGRTRNYPHLFERDGASVTLVKPRSKPEPRSSLPLAALSERHQRAAN
jgi:hypothetical protein